MGVAGLLPSCSPTCKEAPAESELCETGRQGLPESMILSASCFPPQPLGRWQHGAEERKDLHQVQPASFP